MPTLKKEFLKAMGVQKDFSIPIYGTAKGLHQYKFNADVELLRRYQDVDVIAADLDYLVDVYKEDGFIELSIVVDGNVIAACATCLEPLSLPIRAEETIHVKYGEGIDDDECIYVDREASRLDLADTLYQIARLNMPMVWRMNEDNPEHDDLDHECSEEMINYLIQEETEEEKPTSIWDDLRNKLKD